MYSPLVFANTKNQLMMTSGQTRFDYRDVVKNVFAVLAFGSLFAATNALSQTTYSSGAAYECTGVRVENVDPSKLTKEEQIALMDAALLDSVDRYDACMDKVQQKMAASGGGGGGGGGNTGQGSNSGQNQNQTSQEAMTEQSQAPTTPQDSTSGSKRHVLAPKDNSDFVCLSFYDAINDANTTELERRDLIKQYKDYGCEE